ncbi:hypothetical protein [Streptomyces sp. NPDC058613]
MHAARAAIVLAGDAARRATPALLPEPLDALAVAGGPQRAVGQRSR